MEVETRASLVTKPYWSDGVLEYFCVYVRGEVEGRWIDHNMCGLLQLIDYMAFFGLE